MVDTDSGQEKGGRIILTGDTKTCPHCDKDDKRHRDIQSKFHSDKIEYEYVDVYSEKGQQRLRDWGIKEGEKIDIPITKIQACKIETDEKGAKIKKCGPEKDWKDEYWRSIENDAMPEEVSLDL